MSLNLNAISWTVVSRVVAQVNQSHYAFQTAVCLIVILALFLSSKHWPRRSQAAPLVLAQAILTIICPTSATWPRDYIYLVEHTSCSRSKTISISLNSLIDSICRHEIEFRNQQDLAELLSGKLVAYGWHVDLALDGCIGFKVLGWVVGSYFSWKSQKSGEPRRHLKRTHGASSTKENPLPLLPKPDNSHIDLDRTSFAQLDSALQNLRTNLISGEIATLEFTTPASELEFLSTKFIFCAVPLMSRKYTTASPVQRSTPYSCRTTTPLLTNLNQVLQHLTTGDEALVLHSVTNISKEYADKLVASAERLDEDKSVRIAFVNEWGMDGFWEERFMLSWEAALFSTGQHLARWKVVVRK
ncbi:hypothetical protein C8F01DRAFT_11296 [Mycena amicta]|nr:hypothetical protein C8F01DRAFT_11296 [Mycena amicta]